MKVTIKNFVSSKILKYNFVNGINLVCGESGIGKSTILRAVRWCLYGSGKTKSGCI